MSTLDNINIIGLDKNKFHFGESGHVEYSWSDNIKEQIVQFHFQLTRTDESNMSYLSRKLSTILETLKTSTDSNAKTYLSTLYKIIAHTRDIIAGKGEYALTYMMIYTWYTYYPILADFALKCLVNLGNDAEHPYGSWKDIKYFCDYCAKMSSNKNHPLIKTAIRLTNDKLIKDYKNSINHDTISLLSLAAKWVPREKSKYSWLYEDLATDYYSEFIATATTPNSMDKAIKKCKTEYRRVLSELNRKIDTIQIRQCARVWSTIEFNKVTSISMVKQKKAFMNLKKDGEIKYPDDIDRVRCFTNFSNYMQKVVDGKLEVKGKRISMVDFTKQALEIISDQETHTSEDAANPDSSSNIERNMLNAQWAINSSQNDSLGNVIAMVDVSGSMNGDPLCAAIALGIRISEKSAIGKRVLTFSSSPKWVNLDNCNNDFVSRVDLLRRAEWGANTNFYAALNMILDAIIENKMSPEDVQDMVLVILSDMQMDHGDRCDKKALYTKITEKYEAAGIRVHGIPYKPPHILFWNLRSTNGFPTLSNQINTSMMSGFSPVLLNSFSEHGVTNLQSYTPWSRLEKSLEHERYKIMADKLNSYA